MLKNGFLLPDQIIQAATSLLSIGSEAGLQAFQPVEDGIQRLIEFLADVATIALRIGMGFGRLCSIPAFGGSLPNFHKNLIMPVQLPRHIGDDRAQEIEGFPKGCIGQGRAGRTGVGHQIIRDQRKGKSVKG